MLSAVVTYKKSGGLTSWDEVRVEIWAWRWEGVSVCMKQRRKVVEEEQREWRREGARSDTSAWRRNYPGERRGIGKGIPKRRNIKCKAPRANVNVYLIQYVRKVLLKL